MKFGIVHFTDIHFTEKTSLDNKTPLICDAILREFRGIETLFFVISGDIAYSGKELEYKRAKGFFSVLNQLIIGGSPKSNIKYICIPGNHDCNFDEHDSQLRRNAIANVNYQTLGSDNSVIDSCLIVQKNFWEFYSTYRSVPKDKLVYKVEEKVGEKVVRFFCMNTAWMSQKNEQVGGIFFPVKRYEDQKNLKDAALNFAVWHHPYNWFNPNTQENNKKEFEKFTEQIASTHFFGHEHEQSTYSNDNMNTGDKINLVSGKLLNDDRFKNDSGFQTVLVDLETNKGQLKSYRWNKSMYITEDGKELDLDRETRSDFKVRDEFLNVLEEINIPLVIDNRKAIKLSEVFVFPDLENFNTDSTIFENYLNSSKLVESGNGNCVLDGESQIGKSSLLSMLYVKFLDRSTYPILLKGKDFKDLNLEKLIKRTLNSQYLSDDMTFERYMQLDLSKKILLIDDFQECELNSTTTKKLYDDIITKFGKVIIAIDAANSILPSMRTDFHDVNFYSIKPLGYKKRNEIIERYQILKENPYTVNEQTFLDTVKSLFDSVQSILGDKLMPPYPIYVLSILQALEYKPLKQNETSFGYCYQTLLHYSLYKAGVANDDMDSYFNFLSELAYEFIKRKKQSISRSDLNKFYFQYEDRFIAPPYEALIKTLKRAKIVQEEDTNFKFGYDYILYYLSAKKISDIIHTNEGHEIITDLFQHLHIERNANILVFITHHSKDISFIEESLLNSMIVLDSIKPITLEKNDPFYNEILGFAEELKNDILEINRNPKEEREKLLAAKDEKRVALEIANRNVANEEYRNIQESTLPFKRSFRSIEIVGQIIKNRKGSLERSQLIEMISELYTTGFRTIGYISNLLLLAKDDIIEVVNKELEDSEDVYEIQKKINRFIQLTSFEACLGVFSKLMHSMGQKDLKYLYQEVAQTMGTPAAKLVSFGINSYYGTISPDELKKLSEEFKGNIVALRMLKARVKSYVYNRNLDYKTKQRFASALNMEISPINPYRSQERKL